MTAAREEGAAALEALLALQEEDLHADQLAYGLAHLPERADLAELEASLSTLAAEVAPLRAEHDRLSARQSELETELDRIDARIAAINAAAHGAAGGSFRDQGAMMDEITSLGARKRQVEDDELEVMEALEPVTTGVAAADVRHRDLEAQRAVAAAALASAETAQRALLEESRARRQPLAAAVPPALLGEYERLRQRLGGIGAARVVHGTCSGCNLALPATELDRLRRAAPGSVAHCEQCGRILVV